MPKHNRNTLKSFFSDGAMPSSDMFEGLIDSTINLSDDGFEKTPADGIKIANVGDHKKMMSYYDQGNRDDALWEMRFDGNDNNLVLGSPVITTQRGDQEISQAAQDQISHAICLDKSRHTLKVGIGCKTPKDTLDVNGTTRSVGRRGTFGNSFQTQKTSSSLGAGSQWKSITSALKGGVVLEVVARAKNDEKKYYGLMHAIAMHSPWRAKRDLWYFLRLKNKIRYTHAVYASIRHKIKLRWHREKGEEGYRLQINSCCEYGDDGILDYHITSLWSDEDEFNPVIETEAGAE